MCVCLLAPTFKRKIRVSYKYKEIVKFRKKKIRYNITKLLRLDLDVRRNHVCSFPLQVFNWIKGNITTIKNEKKKISNAVDWAMASAYTQHLCSFYPQKAGVSESNVTGGGDQNVFSSSPTKDISSMVVSLAPTTTTAMMKIAAARNINSLDHRWFIFKVGN